MKRISIIHIAYITIGGKLFYIQMVYFEFESLKKQWSPQFTTSGNGLGLVKMADF